MEPETEFLFTTPFTEADWLEAVHLFSPAQLAVGRKRAVTTLTAYVEDFDKLKNCLRFLMGYSWVDESKNLRRVRPARHPIWPNLVCTEILEATGITFTSKQDVAVDGDLPWAAYEKFRVVASFNQVPWVIADDSAGTEDDRWTTFNHKPYDDEYEIPGGEVLFIADNPAQAWDGKPVPGRVVIRSQKALYELKWFECPYSFVHNADGAAPKLDAAIGKISSDVYAGKDIGCWEVHEVDIEPYNDPLVGDVLQTTGRMCDVTIRMKLWEPPHGHATNAARGWGLLLAVDGKGYPYQRQVGVQPMFQTVEIASLFRHWSLP